MKLAGVIMLTGGVALIIGVLINPEVVRNYWIGLALGAGYTLYGLVLCADARAHRRQARLDREREKARSDAAKRRV